MTERLNKWNKELNERVFTRDVSKKYERKAVSHFLRPANFCELCGGSMKVDPITGKDKQLTENERKWSIHALCHENMMEQLDKTTR